DVIRRELLRGDALVRERAVAEVLEVFDGRFALEDRLTHTGPPGSTTPAKGCKARSDELSWILAGLYNNAHVICPLCGVRRARRGCPALGKQICAVCCGTKRLVEIQCPSDCAYLATAREHPP